MTCQAATRPLTAPDVVSIAELAMFSSVAKPAERSTEEVVAAVRMDWPFEVKQVDEEAGNGVTITFSDGSTAQFSAWK